MSLEKVSVVIPVHGNLEFLTASLNSVSAQLEWGSNLDCVVVFDRVPKEIQESIKNFYNITNWRFFESDKAGIVSALNLGVQKSTGSLIARLDADDLMLPERIQAQYKHFQKNPDLVLLGSQVLEIDKFGTPIGLRKYPMSDKQIRKFSSVGSPFAHPAVMFRKEAFIKAGGYRDFYTYAEDFDLFLRLLELGSAENLPEALTHYRVHDNQISVLKKKAQLIAEVGVKEARKARSRQKNEPSMNFPTMTEWWDSLDSSLYGLQIKTNISLRTIFYTNKNIFVRLCIFSLLLFINPKLFSNVLIHKFLPMKSQ